MKRIALALLLIIAVGTIASAVESDLYVKTLYVERVYVTTLGYRVDYRTESSLILSTSYIPLDWFGGPGSMARLVAIQDSTVPYVQVIWDEGEFSHLVLYVHPNQQHLSWGRLQMTPALEAEFDIEEPSFKF